MRVIDLIKQFPEKPWNYSSLTLTKSISITDMLETQHLPWNWKTFSNRLERYTIHDVLAHPDLDWDWEEVSSRNDVTPEIVAANKVPWNYDGLARNPNITMKYIYENPQLPWNFQKVSFNMYLTQSDINNNHTKDWDWGILSFHSLVTIDLLLAFPEKPWNWEEVSWNPNITFQNILDHPELPWVYWCISGNSYVTIDLVLSHPSIYWDHSTLKCYNEVTIDHLLEYMAIPWNWAKLSEIMPIQVIQTYSQLPWIMSVVYSRNDYVSENPLLTEEDYCYASLRSPDIDYVKNTITAAWFWDNLTRSIPIDTIMENIGLSWDMKILSERADLTANHILNNTSLEWDWGEISPTVRIKASELFNNMHLPWDFSLLYYITND